MTNVAEATPTTARQALTQFERDTNPRAITRIRYQDAGHDCYTIHAVRGSQDITIGLLSGEPGRWIALDLLDKPRGWTFARKTRAAAVDDLLAGEGCAVSARIVHSSPTSIDLHVVGHVMATAYHASARRTWTVKHHSEIIGEPATRAAAVDILAKLAFDRFGEVAEIIR